MEITEKVANRIEGNKEFIIKFMNTGELCIMAKNEDEAWEKAEQIYNPEDECDFMENGWVVEEIEEA